MQRIVGGFVHRVGRVGGPWSPPKRDFLSGRGGVAPPGSPIASPAVCSAAHRHRCRPALWRRGFAAGRLLCRRCCCAPMRCRCSFRYRSPPECQAPIVQIVRLRDAACRDRPRSRYGTARYHRRAARREARTATGGGGRTRTYEGVSQRIYSPPPLPLGTLPLTSHRVRRDVRKRQLPARGGQFRGSWLWWRDNAVSTAGKAGFSGPRQLIGPMVQGVRGTSAIRNSP